VTGITFICAQTVVRDSSYNPKVSLIQLLNRLSYLYADAPAAICCGANCMK